MKNTPTAITAKTIKIGIANGIRAATITKSIMNKPSKKLSIGVALSSLVKAQAGKVIMTQSIKQTTGINKYFTFFIASSFSLDFMILYDTMLCKNCQDNAIMAQFMTFMIRFGHSPSSSYSKIFDVI